MQKVGPDTPGFFERFFATPPRDFFMIAAQQNFWDAPAAKFRRTRVLGKFKESRGEGIIACAFGGAKHSGDETDDGVDEDDGGNYAVGQDVISDGDLVIHEMIDDSLIDPFVMTAQDDEMFGGGKRGGGVLIEPDSAR